MLRRKVELAMTLWPQTAKQRLRRLRIPATTSCLEDVDMEVVSEQQDNLRRMRVAQPFLRLRFRYTGSVSYMPWAYRAPWGGVGPLPCDAFEFECDDVDLDVLLCRLLDAKRLLASAQHTDKDENS